MALLPFLHKLMDRESLSADEARQAMAMILQGEATTAQIAAFAVALRVKGETAEELRGLAEAMRESAIPVEHAITDRPVLDTCGTGGDGQNTLNVSTVAALVVASAGVPVAKHGNRSASSLCGSADLLEALGAKPIEDPRLIARSIREVGFGFLYAPALQPAMKHARAARTELKARTVFNLLGPLANPAKPTVQVVGAPSLKFAELLAVTLSSLGLRRGCVVHGASGLDEVSTTGESSLYSITRGAIGHSTVTPEDFGVERVSIERLRAGDADTNREIATAVLCGHKGPHRDIVVVNAAVALMTAGAVATPQEGTAMAVQCIESGAAKRMLQAFVEFTHNAGG